MKWHTQSIHTQSIPIVLVKTEYESWNQMRLSQGNELVVAVNNADAHLLMTFPDLTCYLVDTGMFYGCTASPDIKDTKLISSNQETYPSVGKNTGLVFMPCWTWKLVQLFPVVWILSRYLGVICYDIWDFIEGNKNYVKHKCLMNSELTFLIFTSFLMQQNGNITQLSKI